MSTFAFDSPAAAIDACRAALGTVGTKEVPLAEAVGRLLALAPTLDRDSPACDLSAMDGYAVGAPDLPSGTGSLSVLGAAAAGSPPPEHVAGSAVRIFTGAPVPAGCDRVIRQEQVRREGRGRAGTERIVVPAGLATAVPAGANVRRRGENGRAGDPIAEPGTLVNAAVVAAAAACGLSTLTVRRRVRVAVLVTGEEVRAAPFPAAVPLRNADARLPVPMEMGSRELAPWEVRDANGPAVAALLARRPYLRVSPPAYVGDDPTLLAQTLAVLLDRHDAVVTTGGVSVGDYDLVPDAVRAIGGRPLFHGLPIRPGKPVFAAVVESGTGAGRLALGLPGNPVAALCVARRIGIELLRHVAGFPGPEPTALVEALPPDDPADGRADGPLPLWRFRPVRLDVRGDENAETAGGLPVATAVDGRGASDTVALARSDGFVEVPPGAATAGRLPYRAW
ncbi:molybdopterin molybdotransferase MoeA [Alienimonas californiensis]|uniref:Molybdopterin molybdenumtransferase n=1 Tax=Alienimonas californiensis TaxID=2527989 RepID=A0A517P5P7_9PLAN|nr:molybdopterin molybdotransferase MoeA [Alienimonas californiensis]QDT14694.1 Molybdopterin molybdenumtransferase [Alienimonas californiensis]